ncbi:hypothetical protein GC102_20830 [Paenibacillus sp. LMG 31460]|uniref:DUF4362 domain-containing protein n=1 Tax=Paenibacillus germinis TaxID=2654979 RepID=A0ABX1Z480_9BACL|nr:hypothetical protein [Paenibacillus germinis]NOU88195.1 hypothetical protein [Paenibacillus germinis]
MKLRRFFQLLFYLSVVIIIVGIVLMKSSRFDLINQFKSFSYTIDNQSDYNIISVETGINTSNRSGERIDGASKDIYKKIIKSGEKVKITPDIKLYGEGLSGEGSIYLKYTDSRGKSFEKGLCGYTESVSGYSKVSITNDEVTVTENCR